MDHSDPRQIAAEWLSQFAKAVSAQNVTNAVSSFLSDGWLRDVLVFTWDSRSLEGTEKISQYLSATLAETHLSDFDLDPNPSLKPEYGPLSPWASGVSFAFTFATPIALGKGYARIQNSDGQWKAFTVFMMLDSLKGYPEIGPEEGVYSGHTVSWSEVNEERKNRTEEDPYVLIIGAGQNGLHVAARFKQMGIPTLVVEKNDRIGDNWRKRYETLTLHTIKTHHTLLYQPFPTTWPVYTPRDKLAHWLEQYALSQDLVIWTGSQPLPHPIFDPFTQQWTVVIDRRGQRITLNPSHIVIATGHNGAPNIPTNIKDQSLFKGRLLHTSAFTTGKEFRGERVIVVGAGNSSADVCQDCCVHGAQSVTMVQRSATAVVKSSSIRVLHEREYPEGQDPFIGDFKFFATPMLLFKRMLAFNAKEILEQEKDIHEPMKRAGMKIHMGDDGSGILPMVFDRGGGYWLDVGAAQLIGSGKIKIKQGSEIERFTEESVVFQDGTSLPADVVIFATGFKSMRDSHRGLFGDEIIDTTCPVWGLDEEGEIQGCYRPSGHPRVG